MSAWTVLVVDDEPEILRFLQTTIERSIPGVHTLAAKDGLDALATLRSEPVDLVLSDHRMPVMGGIEFLTLAAKLAPDVPRVLLTGFADADIATRALNDGHVSAFFQKPVPTQSLIDAIVRLLEVRQAALHRAHAFARIAELRGGA